ncbi:MAG: Gfo/Idh/MocA family protein [Promethearchaeota archaeon]
MNETTKEKQVINIGVIGCGCIAQNHVFSLSLIENNARKIWKGLDRKIKPRLYALADIDDAALDGLASHFPVKKLYRGKNAGYDLIKDPDIHAVFVLVPTVYHLDYVLRAIEEGKHVFCEKPLAFTPADVQKMIDARDKHGVIVQPGLVFRSAPQIFYLKKLYEDNKGKWGKLTNIIFRDSQEKPYKGAEEVHNSTWRGDKELAHAGILFEHTIHDIDGMILILGEVDEVYARINYHAGHEGIEDSVAAILSFKNGVNLSVNSMWNDIDFSARRFELFFENAYVMVTVDEREDKAVKIKVKYLKEDEYELNDEEMDTYFREKMGFSHVKPEISGPYYYEDLRFINAIVENTPTDVKLEHGLYVQSVIEACYESSKKNKVIKISDFQATI